MNEISSFVFKKFKYVLVIKKIYFGFSKYQICFVRFLFFFFFKK